MTNKYIPQFEPEMRKEYADDVHSQIMSGWVGSGQTCLDFEEKIQYLTGAKHAIATTSGTSAILLALYAMRLPKGSTVLFPAYTFIAGANVAKFLGYRVRLVDVDMDTMCMSPDKLKETVNKYKISAVIYVNHNGYTGSQRDEIKKICDEEKVWMLEDSSQALGMPNNPGMVGDVGIFSFSVPKIITTGQGGVLFTNNNKLAEYARRLRDHGDNNWRKTGIHKFLGINLKFDDIHASLGLAQLKILPELIERKKQIFTWYKKYLDDDKKLMMPNPEFGWMVIYRTLHAEKYIENLNKVNIQAVQYYQPIYFNKVFECSAIDEDDDNAYLISKIYLYLPSSLNLTEEEIKTICEILNQNML